MTRGPRITALVSACAVFVACGWLGYRHGQVQRAERVVELKPRLDAWRSGFERDLRRIEGERAAVEQWVDAAASELSRMQARVLQLEALAERLVARTSLHMDEFDFDRAPGIGGPEEPPMERAALPERWDAVSHRVATQIDDRRMQLQILEDMLKWRDLSAAVSPEGRPVRAAYVSSGFGARIDPFTGREALHKGIDFAGRHGSEIVAVAAGIVTWSGSRAGYGEMVEIDHGQRLATRYAHNAKNLVEVGDVVMRGQTIAWLGATGRATGPNLHFEVLHDGKAVNPLPYIE